MSDLVKKMREDYENVKRTMDTYPAEEAAPFAMQTRWNYVRAHKTILDRLEAAEAELTILKTGIDPQVVAAEKQEHSDSRARIAELEGALTEIRDWSGIETFVGIARKAMDKGENDGE